MAYTTPRTWTAGEVVTAGMMNQDVRDNITAVNARKRSWEHHRLINDAVYHQAGTPLNNDFASTFTPTINQIYALPFITGRACTATRLAWAPTTVGGSNPFARAAIYTSHATTMKPETLVVESGSLANGGDSAVQATISAALTADTLYWLTLLESEARAVYGYALTRGYALLGTTSPGVWNYPGWQAAFTYAAYPSSATSLTWNGISGQAAMPSVWLRLAP